MTKHPYFIYIWIFFHLFKNCSLQKTTCFIYRLTTTLTCLIGLVASKFSDKLNEKASQLQNKDHINTLITNVFYEVTLTV